MVMEHKALSRYEVSGALVARSGFTTADGLVTGATLIDSALIGSNDFITNKAVLITSGDAEGEISIASSFDPVTGQINFSPNFSAQIVAGVTYKVLNFATHGTVMPGSGESLSYHGVVTAVPGANQFTIPGLIGHGAGKFSDVTAPYRAFVLRDAGGAGAAPQGEMQLVTGYTTTTGVFITAPFTAAVAVGDEILLLHPRLGEIAILITELAKVPKSDSNVSWNATALQAIQDEAEDALEGENLDHLAAVTDGAGNFPNTAVDGSIISKMISKVGGGDTSSYDETTDSLEAISDKVTTVEGKVDTVDGVVDGNATKLGRVALHKDQWCATPQATVAIPAVAADLDFSNVVFPAGFLPAGHTIQAVYLIMKWRKHVDSSGGANAINGAGKKVRVKKSTGVWGTDDVAGITMADNQLATDASLTDPGDVIIGDTDIKSEVDSVDNVTYNIRSEQTNRADALVVDGASLTLYDVYTGLRVYYTL